jgi:putative aldouronate transport system permease protein
MNRSFNSYFFNFSNYLFFIILGIIMLYPMWYVIMYSLSDPTSNHLNNLYLLPDKFTLDSYKYVLTESLIFTGLKNSIIITVSGTAISLIVISFAAYTFSREKLIGKNIIFGLFLFTMLFGGGLVPTYLVVKQLGMVDTLWALILPNTMNVYFMLIMIRFFRSIPSSLIESAKIDGGNEIYILFRIVLPMSTAALAAVGLFSAVGYWNDYLSGVIYINHSEHNPLQVILYSLLSQSLRASELGYENFRMTPDSIKMSTVVVALAPILIVYPFIQKHFSKGVMLGAVKG